MIPRHSNTARSRTQHSLSRVVRISKVRDEVKREVRDIKGAARVRVALIFYVFGDLPEKTH